jgi:hypothetical protein
MSDNMETMLLGIKNEMNACFDKIIREALFTYYKNEHSDCHVELDFLKKQMEFYKTKCESLDKENIQLNIEEKEVVKKEEEAVSSTLQKEEEHVESENDISANEVEDTSEAEEDISEAEEEVEEEADEAESVCSTLQSANEVEDISEAEEEDEVFEIVIQDKKYFTNNETNGDIYDMDENEDPNEKVGYFKNKIPVFLPAPLDGSLGDMIYFFKLITALILVK